jgi:Ca2+-binding EF-hand superfamily protein
LGLEQLEVTFDQIVDAFVFFDTDGDGYVTKTEIVEVVDQASPGSRNASAIGLQRFGL